MTSSDKIYIVRDGSRFGPYAVSDALSYFERGLLFEHDLAFEVGKAISDARSLVRIFKDANVKAKSSSIWRQFGSLVRNNHALLLPVKCLFSTNWFSDKQTITLMMIGCTPLVLMVLDSKLVGYMGLAAYFSALWGMFFFNVFKTSQTSSQDAMRAFFQTPFFASVLISATRYIPPFKTLYGWTLLDSLPLRWVGMFLAVAVVEEICKAFPVYLLARRPGRVLQPRTVVLYGIISGLGFGIWEGVAYQLGINRKQGVDMAYFLNILRLTSLPFIHAIWAGISSYFVAFSMLLPRTRWSLRVIAILIPAFLHAMHNTFPGIISVLVDLLSVVLLMLYLGNGRALFVGIKKNSISVP